MRIARPRAAGMNGLYIAAIGGAAALALGGSAVALARTAAQKEEIERLSQHVKGLGLELREKDADCKSARAQYDETLREMQAALTQAEAVRIARQPDAGGQAGISCRYY